MTGHHMDHISCEEVIRSVWDFLDGEIDAERKERIRAHLGTCDHCRDHYTFEGAFLRSVASVLDGEADDADSLRRQIETTLLTHGFPRGL